MFMDFSVKNMFSLYKSSLFWTDKGHCDIALYFLLMRKNVYILLYIENYIFSFQELENALLHATLNEYGTRPLPEKSQGN